MLTKSKFPESRHPCRFDLVGASHQLFHILVLVAGIVHYTTLSKAFLEVRGHGLMC